MQAPLFSFIKRINVLALSGRFASSFPRGRAKNVAVELLPLPLGEVALRSNDGEGGPAKGKERVLPMLITPEYVFKDVTHITPEWLAAKGITALVLDIDNTLTADRSQELPEEVAGWLDTMRSAGVKLTIVSNGAEKRVRPFAQKLGLAYLYRAAKPLPFALMVAQRRMGVKHSQMAMVGDQLYADRMAAALYGIPGLMVVPRGPDLGAQVILKRKWEKRHWQQYYDRGGKTL